MKKILFSPILFLILFSFGFQPQSTIAGIGKGSPQFRAISGISMGGYGAMNIGLTHPDLFSTVACLGGPMDMNYLLKYIEVDMLGDYDHIPSYPDRETLIHMFKDLVISFGNPAYYNPLSTYYPPRINSENAAVPTTLLNFFDRELNPDGNLPVITFEDPVPGDWIEVLLALDQNGNKKRDMGEPVIRQFHEPFTDTNGNGMFDPGEPFLDVGLDGVPDTGDFGEGDGLFTYSPYRENFMAEDPLSHAKNIDLKTLQNLNLYLDAGTEDEFQFNIHTENFVQAIKNRGLGFRIEDGFPRSFPSISRFKTDKRVYVRYEGGHVGFDEEDLGLSFQQIKEGIQGAVTVVNRITTLFAFASDHFPSGKYGSNFFEMLFNPSEMDIGFFHSPSLNQNTTYGIYLPPGYEKDETTFYPVLYFLGGYNMSLDGMANEWIQAALDALILSRSMQKMIIVFVEGRNDKNGRGHFFVNQIDQERGDLYMNAFLDLVSFIDTHFRTK